MGVSTDEKSKRTSKQSTEANGEATSERPPSYSAEQVEQPPLQLRQLDLTSCTSSPTVTRDQCVAHLKFLAILADLREGISSDDGLFGIQDAEAERFPESLNEARARIREKRWAVYTARAVDRYTKWWSIGLPRSRPMATVNDLEHEGYEKILNCDTRVAWSPENLPPIGKCAGRTETLITNDILRYFDGLACSFVESSQLSRRLYSIRQVKHLGHRIPLGCDRPLRRQPHVGVQGLRASSAAVRGEIELQMEQSP